MKAMAEKEPVDAEAGSAEEVASIEEVSTALPFVASESEAIDDPVEAKGDDAPKEEAQKVAVEQQETEAQDNAAETHETKKEEEQEATAQEEQPPRRRVIRRKLKTPGYPVTKTVLVSCDPLQPSQSICNVFESVLTHEQDAIADTYQGHFDFVSRAVTDISHSFLQSLPKSKPLRSLRRKVAVERSQQLVNPNIALKEREKAMRNLIGRLSKEREEWDTVEETYLESMQAPSNSAVEGSSLASALPLEDQKLLEDMKACAMLPSMVADSYGTISVGADSVATRVRSLKRTLDQVEHDRRAYAQTVSSSAGISEDPAATAKTLFTL